VGRLALGGVIAVLLIGAEAAASSADDAEALVQEGIALRSKLHDVEALDRFQRAFEIAKTARIQAQIGAAEQALGRWVAAEVHLAAALEATSDIWIVKNRPTLETALGTVRSHLGSLEILGQPVGAEVRIDGETLGRLPLPTPLRLPVGKTTLEVRAAGYFPVSRVVTIEPQILTRESVALRSDDSATSAVEPRIDARETAPPSARVTAVESAPAVAPGSTTAVNWRRPTELTVASLAVVGLAVGIVEHLRWQSKIDSFESMDACGGTLPDRGGASCAQLYSDGHGARNVAFVAYGAAAALGITAAVLFLTDPPRESERSRVACYPNALERGVACAAKF
jgi:hypothetical protein